MASKPKPLLPLTDCLRCWCQRRKATPNPAATGLVSSRLGHRAATVAARRQSAWTLIERPVMRGCRGTRVYWGGASTNAEA